MDKASHLEANNVLTRSLGVEKGLEVLTKYQIQIWFSFPKETNG